MTLCAIDPGVAGQGCAVALFSGLDLVRAFFAHPSPTPEDDPRFRADGDAMIIVVEMPEAQGRRSKFAHAGDLMRLSWAGAALAFGIAGAAGGHVIPRTPTEWKGSARKPQHHARAWMAMTDDEHRILGGVSTGRAIDVACEKGALDRWSKPGVTYYPRGFTAHNLLDAAALGLTHLGRLRK